MSLSNKQPPHIYIITLAVILVGAVLTAGFVDQTTASPAASEPALVPTAKQPTVTPTPQPSPTRAGQATASPTPKPTRPSPSPTATPIATPTTSPTATPLALTQHALQAGESLWSVAAEYGVPVEEITALNKIDDPTTLQIGQKLMIPVTAMATATPAPSPTRRGVTPTPMPALVFHTIQAGDTLLALSLDLDIPVDLMLMVNPMLDPNNLQIGQKVLIPPAKGDLPDPVVWAPQLDYAVESGDTLLDIALAHGSSVEDILTVNPDLAETTLLQIGQMLKVPLTRPRPRSGPGNDSPAPAKLPSAPALSEADLAALRDGSPSLVGLEAEMAQAVNAERAAYDLPPFTIDEQLTLLAWGQAQDMVKRGYFSHITPEGRTLRDRIKERHLPTHWVGENIYLSVKPANQAVEATIGWFMGDAPHRRNILHQNFNRLGIGVAQGESGWYTFVLVFAGD